jgi:ankyrin repeat protein
MRPQRHAFFCVGVDAGGCCTTSQALEDGDAATKSTAVNAFGWTCFHVAAHNLAIDCIRVIVKRVGTRSPLIHACTMDELQQTSVHLAVLARPAAVRSEAERAILPMIRELVVLGADATARDAEAKTPEDLAKAVSLSQVAAVLKEVESPSSKLTRAVVAGDDEAVRSQLEDMTATGSLAHRIDGKGRDGLSALHHACKQGFMSGVGLLLEFKASVLDSDIHKGACALWWATRYGIRICSICAPAGCRLKI